MTMRDTGMVILKTFFKIKLSCSCIGYIAIFVVNKENTKPKSLTTKIAVNMPMNC